MSGVGRPVYGSALCRMELFTEGDKLCKIFNAARYGVYINDGPRAFTELIFDGVKTVETRDRDLLGRFTGQWVGMIRTGTPGRNGLVGFMRLGTPFKYSWAEFWDRCHEHWVLRGSIYAPRRGKKDWAKVGYPILEAVRCRLYPLPASGQIGTRPWRRL